VLGLWDAEPIAYPSLADDDERFVLRTTSSHG
jgi:hypothetical protein